MGNTFNWPDLPTLFSLEVATENARRGRDHEGLGLLSDEALLTLKIEGELLNRDSLQSSIRRLFGLSHDGREASPAALSQAFGQPTLVVLSLPPERHCKRYDEELGAASRTIEITGWLEFFGSMVLAAQEQSLRRIGFLVEKAKFFERYRGQLNERQEKMLLRMFREGVDGFNGGLSSKNHIKITACSPATATRDLAKLAELGAMLRTGELKSARYFLKLG